MKNENTKGLSPTLWRTCRILAGVTRLSLLRRIIQVPGQCVSDLAKAEKISKPRASQELRRLQSRGLVQVERRGRYVRYYPESDPLVSSAKPLLQAMRATFRQIPPEMNDQVAKTAMGLSHAKRMAVVRVLREGPRDIHELAATLRMPVETVRHHMDFLKDGGWVECTATVWKLAAIDSPLAKCLMKLL